MPNSLKHTTSRIFADDTRLTAAGETLGEAERRENADLKEYPNLVIGK